MQRAACLIAGGGPAGMMCGYLLARAGIDSFVYTRGNGDEILDLGSEWLWRAPDGSERALRRTPASRRVQHRVQETA